VGSCSKRRHDGQHVKTTRASWKVLMPPGPMDEGRCRRLRYVARCDLTGRLSLRRHARSGCGRKSAKSGGGLITAISARMMFICRYPTACCRTILANTHVTVGRDRATNGHDPSVSWIGSIGDQVFATSLDPSIGVRRGVSPSTFFALTSAPTFDQCYYNGRLRPRATQKGGVSGNHPFIN